MLETSGTSPTLHPVAYPATYIRELSPAWLAYAASLCGEPCHPLDTRFRYLELGCGQGLSTLVHAAAFPHAEFHACDSSSSAIDAARRRAAELAVSNVTFHRQAFDAVAGLDLGSFDFVVAHGVYSWVDEGTRDLLRRLIRMHLASAGIAYLSYNCLPGWAAEVPLRRLMRELASRAEGDACRRASTAAAALETLSSAGFGYFLAAPEAGAAVRAYRSVPAAYLVHELLGDAWAPLYSVDVADAMSSAGLTLLGSATLADNHPPLLVDESRLHLVHVQPTPRLRQLAMDFAVNRRLRRDLFMRRDRLERRAPSTSTADPILGSTVQPHHITSTIDVPRGRITFDRDFIRALVLLMRGGPAPLRGLASALAQNGAERSLIVRNLHYLVAGGQLAPCARVGHPVARNIRRVLFASVTTARMIRRIAASGGSGWVPSAITGSGIAMDHAEARAIIEWVTSGQTARISPPAREHLIRLGIVSPC